MLEAGQVADHCGGEWGDRGTLRGAGKASWNRHRVILARGLRRGPDREQRGWRRGAPGCAQGVLADALETRGLCVACPAAAFQAPRSTEGAFSAWADAVRARPGSEGSVRSILSISRRGTCSSWSTVGRWRALHPFPVLEGVARVPVPRSPTPAGREGIFEVTHLHQVSL